ncbi:unnamed protein product [Echinostoma caproni]|uniref:EGF-like domain-containing protein n=1 Tax=Echinostoma caproni TaxID=27848 RepID=A0A183AMF5_9TREM|nr:unnamed protein product [Echinostoma caproni]
MYTWVICSYIGSSPSQDVDGICPKLCRPHTNAFRESLSVATLQEPSLFYAHDFREDAVDICEQLQFALPGSCGLIDRGVNILDFECECASGAYEWKTTQEIRGCLLKDSIMATESDSNATNWHVLCTPDQKFRYCDPKNTDVCYFRLWKESNEPQLNLTTFVRQSRNPFCHCKKGFAGISCADKFDPCVHLIPLAINDPENYINIHIPDGPHLPLYSNDEISGASGDWLCGVRSGRGMCNPTGDPDSPFKCICSKGYERDELYSDQDNCMKDTVTDRYTEIDGRFVVSCGDGYCLNNGYCVSKTMTDKLEYNISRVSGVTKTSDQLDVTLVCQCPVGYVGSFCDVEENTWSGFFNKFPEVEICCRTVRWDLIAVTKTWLTTDNLDSELRLPGMELLRRDRPTRGGGVLLYHHNSLQCEQIESRSLLPIRYGVN